MIWDLRDKGRPRPADLRSYPRRILEILNVGDLLVLLTPEGYALMDPCGTDIPESLPFGWVDQPVQNAVVTGSSLQIEGWALGAQGEPMRRVEVSVNGKDRYNMERLTTGWSRNDVAALFPDYPDAAFSGFSGTIDLSKLEDGPHRLSVVATEDLPPYFPGIIGIIDFVLDRE